jgi:hypothetical protein
MSSIGVSSNNARVTLTVLLQQSYTTVFTGVGGPNGLTGGVLDENNGLVCSGKMRVSFGTCLRSDQAPPSGGGGSGGGGTGGGGTSSASALVTASSAVVVAAAAGAALLL